MKKNIFKLNISLLSDYDEFLNANPDNWNIVSYLNLKYDTNAALAFSKFFFPDFVEKKGCVILDFLFDKYMCNMYELKDYFHINDNSDDDTVYWERLFALGRVMQRAWQINLKLLYPDRKFKVVLVDDREMDMYYITFFSISSKTNRAIKQK